MKKLNNKGMTAVEVLVCFILVVVISVSMYTMVSSYNNKQQIESYKEKILTYKNLLTKEINDDLIKDGLVSVSVSEFTDTSDEYSAQMNLRNGETKCIKIRRVLAYDYLYDPTDPTITSKLPVDKDRDDDFMISYGDCGNEVEYPIPNLGESLNPNGKKIYDLRINNVNITTSNSILNIYVGFYHPELGTRYGLDIICPINF